VKNGDIVRLHVGGPCGMTFEKLLVRVSPDFKLEVHIDTDEGNACGLGPDTPANCSPDYSAARPSLPYSLTPLFPHSLPFPFNPHFHFHFPLLFNP